MSRITPTRRPRNRLGSTLRASRSPSMRSVRPTSRRSHTHRRRKRISKPAELARAVLSVAEMGRLLSGFALRTDRDIMLAAVCELLYGSALRISEAESLRLTDVSFAKQSLTIYERKTESERVVPATEASLAAVSRYTECAREALTTEADRQAGFLFPQQGRTSLRCLVNRRLARECRRLGLPVMSSHGFRHAAATHMLRSGAGLRHIQAFLGHERIGSTERYTHVVAEDLKRVLAACHPREAVG